MAQHPQVEARFREEIQSVLGDRTPTYADVARLPYTEMILKETMRLYPPTWCLVPRCPTEDQELAGYRIRRDTWTFISPYAMHHDPRFFPEPERFDPERFAPARIGQTMLSAYMPFGAGPRACIGNHFAMATLALMLATVAQRYRFTLCDEPEAIVPDPSLALRPKGGLRVRVHAAHERTIAAAATS